MKRFAKIIIFTLAVSIPLKAIANSFMQEVVRDINAGKYSGIEGILVYQDGIQTEAHYFNQYDADTLHQTRSTFKSITGLLTAIAIDQKLLDANEAIGPLLSEYTRIDFIPDDKQTIKVSNLLHMTSGIDCSEMPGTGPYHDEVVDDGPTPLSYSLSIPMNGEPGEQWRYCNANTYLLGVSISAALKRADKGDIFSFAKQYLFAPLGIQHYEIYTSPDGYLYAQGNARFLPQDLAKLGLLLLEKGKYRSKQIISAQQIEVITHPTADTGWSWTDGIDKHPVNSSRYAYQWFETHFSVMGNTIKTHHTWGNGGQFVFAIPELNSVVVFTGNNYGDIEKQKQAFSMLHRYLSARINLSIKK